MNTHLIKTRKFHPQNTLQLLKFLCFIFKTNPRLIKSKKKLVLFQCILRKCLLSCLSESSELKNPFSGVTEKYKVKLRTSIYNETVLWYECLVIFVVAIILVSCECIDNSMKYINKPTILYVSTSIFFSFRSSLKLLCRHCYHHFCGNKFCQKLGILLEQAVAHIEYIISIFGGGCTLMIVYVK